MQVLEFLLETPEERPLFLFEPNICGCVSQWARLWYTNTILIYKLQVKKQSATFLDQRSKAELPSLLKGFLRLV